MNRLIATLPDEARALIGPHLEDVQLGAKEVLYRAGDPIEYVYFPHSGLVSLVVTMESGRTAECAVVGQDGMVCSAIVLDVLDAMDQATVEIPGAAARIASRMFTTIYRESEELRSVINRYHALLLSEARQSVACNALHGAERRLCRLLAEIQDRTGYEKLPLTQEYLSRLLGLRRSSVTDLYPTLEERGILKGTRGYVEIVRPTALREHACECYSILKQRSKDMFPEWDLR
jgi:CRP-like cAMP-binding protein